MSANLSKRMFRPSQLIFIEKFLCEEEELFFLARRRLGKTRGALMTLMLCAYHFASVIDLRGEMPCDKLERVKNNWKELGRQCTFKYVMPVHDQATKNLSPEIDASIAYFTHNFPELPKWKYVKSGKEFFFTHLGMKYAITYTGIDRSADWLRGGGAEIIIVDEIAQVKNVDISGILAPMLVDSSGFMAIIGTARNTAHINNLKKEYKEADDKQYLQITADDSIELGEITQEEVDEWCKKRYRGNKDHPIFRQEFYMDSDTPIEGAILEGFTFTHAELPDD